MARLDVTSEGQVTLREDVLRHLGVEAGGAIELDLMPDGRAELRAERAKTTFRDLSGILKDKTNGRRLTIDEINEATAEGWSGAGGAKG